VRGRRIVLAGLLLCWLLRPDPAVDPQAPSEAGFSRAWRVELAGSSTAAPTCDDTRGSDLFELLPGGDGWSAIRVAGRREIVVEDDHRQAWSIAGMLDDAFDFNFPHLSGPVPVPDRGPRIAAICSTGHVAVVWIRADGDLTIADTGLANLGTSWITATIDRRAVSIRVHRYAP